MELKMRLQKTTKTMGATYFGVADLSLVKDSPVTSYEKKLITQFHRAVSVGVPLSMSIVDSIGDQSDIYAMKNYWYHVYEAINRLINYITLRIAKILADEGFNAITVPASHTIEVDKLYGLFSHKLAASLAGLGWIGKSCLLITPDRGPRVRWGTVLTDAPMVPDKLLAGKGCGGCTLCIEACPAGAFTGKAFVPSEGREARMDVGKCFSYVHGERKCAVGIETCGLCVYVCPFGKKSTRGKRGR